MYIYKERDVLRASYGRPTSIRQISSVRYFQIEVEFPV